MSWTKEKIKEYTRAKQFIKVFGLDKEFDLFKKALNGESND